MPNWVYSFVNVEGKREDLLAFAEKARQPHESLWATKSGEEIEITKEIQTPDAISFWNFVRPTDEELPYYFGHIPEEKPEGYEGWTIEQRIAHDIKFEGSGWYDWNVRNWGTKWDAGSDELETDLDKLEANDVLTYRYETAWSIPEPVMVAMVEQHPELTFHFECEEEQGWGAEFAGTEGNLSMTTEWDIPNCHADYVARDREGSCNCQHYEDENDWYDDCPDKNKEFEVVIRQVYRVKATSEDNAKDLLVKSLTPAVFQSPDPEKAHFAEETISARLTEDTDELIDLDA